MSPLPQAKGPNRVLLAAFAFIAVAAPCATAQPSADTVLFNDSHFHLTNYIQEGLDIRDLLKIMGDKVGRVAVFGIPLQQQWSYRVTGNRAPRYYLDTDASLYYYSFVDAAIAMQYRSLSEKDRLRFDPMITGFNPTDMYAADHVRRVLKTFPGVFSGIGEFSIHKEFVSSKIAGDVASLTDPALDKILDFAAEAGLVSILHNDFDAPFAKPGSVPASAEQLEALFRRHPAATIIWAHVGLGRVVRPALDQESYVERILRDPAMKNVYFDISWDETAKYLVAGPQALQIAAGLLTRYPDRFLFGTDEVAPPSRESYMKVYEQYAPLLQSLPREVREKVLKGNYESIFNQARTRVRRWEADHVATAR